MKTIKISVTGKSAPEIMATVLSNMVVGSTNKHAYNPAYVMDSWEMTETGITMSTGNVKASYDFTSQVLSLIGFEEMYGKTRVEVLTKEILAPMNPNDQSKALSNLYGAMAARLHAAEKRGVDKTTFSAQDTHAIMEWISSRRDSIPTLDKISGHPLGVKLIAMLNTILEQKRSNDGI